MARIRRNSWRAILTAALFGAATFAAVALANPAAAQVSQEDLLTFHNNPMRTGWNRYETLLTPATVKNGTGGQNFGLLFTKALDEQVDAQPLIVHSFNFNGVTRNVVYVATENNSLYAFDADTGAQLAYRNFGPAVPISKLPSGSWAPGGCPNNSVVVGIDSTPAIDRKTGLLYVMVYTLVSGVQQYYLHAVNLVTLADSKPAVLVQATGKLANGNTYAFNAAVARQRPALLMANGNIYAGFGSFCDFDANVTRGWVLGWNKATLAPLAANQLNSRNVTNYQNNFYLTSVWMSGYGLASPDPGNVYFVTGNSNGNGQTISNINPAESAVTLKADLSSVSSYYTPSNYAYLEANDLDYGSGGLMLVPSTQGGGPLMALAAGKYGTMYALNSANLGTVYNSYAVGGCWCGPSYFVGADGLGRVVTSGGTSLMEWTVNSATSLSPTPGFSKGSVTSSQAGGFYTAISSNGTTANTPLVWAVGKMNKDSTVSLYAFDGTSGALVGKWVGGYWNSPDNNANVFPTVANGKVFVASYKQLRIFGFGAAQTHLAASLVKIAVGPPPRPILPPGGHEMRGFVRAINGGMLTVADRNGKIVKIDTSKAQSEHAYAEPSVGAPSIFLGTIRPDGVFVAHAVIHGRPDPAIWPPDR